VSSAASAELIARDLAAVWHPFTQHALWPADDPLVIDRASGVHLYDTDGRRYLDGVTVSPRSTPRSPLSSNGWTTRPSSG
jgi:4-aminobutyrate aminotransferase-like enzyme